jgi:amidase
VPAESARVFDTIQRTGAVLLGKTNCSDLALAWESNNHLVGATRNPYDETRSAGGSSGGAACAVASGMATFDWGTDFGGSIRIPAAFCGVTGLRLSSRPWPVDEQHFPRLSPHFYSWVGMGPIARTPADCRVVVRALAPLRLEWETPAIRADDVVLYAPDRRCVGRWPTFVDDASRALAAAGVRFEQDPSLPTPWRANHVYNAYLSSHFEQFASTGELPMSEGLPAVLLALASGGRLDRRVHPTSAALLALIALGSVTIFRDRARWEDALEDVRERVRAVWRSGRLLVSPTSTSYPPKHGRSALDWTVLAFTKLGNLVDATAVAVPFGTFLGTRLPRSLQILGPPGSEDAVLDLAQRLAHSSS